MKQVKPFIFPVTAWLLKSQNCSKHCLSVKHFTSRCKIYQLPNFKHAQKAKFQDSFWVLKWHSSLDFHSSLSHLLSSSALFLAPFFPFCWAFTTLYFSGEVFGKAFRIVGLDARKCRCEQHHCNLREKALFFFSSLLDWIILILDWFEISRSLGQLRWQRQVDLDHQNWWHQMR